MRRQLSTALLVALAIFTQFNLSSCKKSNGDPSPDDDGQEALLMDSTYYFSLLYSLWNDKLPQPRVLSGNQFDLRSFTRNYSDAEEVLEALIDRMPKNTAGKPLDRFSFIDRQRQVSEEIEQGLHRDIGISPQFYSTSNSNQVVLFIRLVQKNSPAAAVGLKRGEQIIAVDGVRVNFTAGSNNQVQGDIAAFNKIMNGQVGSLEVYNPDTQQTRTVNIPTMGSYIIDPIVEKKVLELDNGTKVGYIAYDSFVSVRNSGTSNIYYTEMVNAFRDFENKNIDELVVDLRYNGGGAGNASDLMTNIIVPNGNNGKMMYRYVVNGILSRAGWDNEDDPKAPFVPEYIDKTGLPDLGLSKVYFLVTDRSASASELVINALKPYMDVQIIASNEGTYGKPVGSFRQRVLNGYADLYLISFQMVNAAGYGNYFDGLKGDKQKVRDDIEYQLGDPQENMLKEALFHIENNRYRNAAESSGRAQRAGVSRQGQRLSEEILNAPEFEHSVQGLFIFDQIDIK